MKRIATISKYALILLLITGWIFSSFPQIFNFPPKIQKAQAVNYLTNPSFTGGTTGWTLTTTVYDSVYYQDTAGSAKTATAVGRNTTGTGSAQQTISTSIVAGSIVKLSLFWSKQCVGVACALNTIEVDIAKPSAPTTWIAIWSNTTIPAAGSATAWTGLSNLDVSSYFTETGQYNFRLYANLRNGNGATAQSLAWFDNITLDVTPPAFNQSVYRLFNNLDSTDVGTPLATQNTSATLGSAGAAFRLRLLMYVSNANLNASALQFKLQFAQRGTDNLCDTAFSGETYQDVATSTVIAYKDNPTPADGAALTANANDPIDGTNTIVNQTYEELNNFTNSVAAIPSGQDGKWDFALYDNGAPANTTYCFRVVKADGTLLDTYTVIPQITTAAAAIVSVSVSDGAIAYGIIPTGSTKDTCALNDTQTVTNDGNVPETFNIMGSTSTNWALGTTAGTDTYVHKFSTSSCPVTWGGTALTTAYQTLATNVAANATTTLNLQITTPTDTTYYTQQSLSVTIQAVQY